MSDNSSRSAIRIATLAICTALVCVFTLIVRIPTTRGYLNLCDVAICFISFTLGPVSAFVSGGLGTAIADVAGGYSQWAPVTFVCHGVEGLVAALVLRGNSGKAGKALASIAVIVCVAGGYFLLSGIFLTGFDVALTEIPGNIMQSAVGAIFGLILSEAVKKAYPPVKSLGF